MSVKLRIASGMVAATALFVVLIFPQQIISLDPDHTAVVVKEVTTMSVVPEQKLGTTTTVDSTQNNRIAFLGDLMLARHVEYLMTEYGYAYPYQGLSAWLATSTHVLVNFEGAIPLWHRKTPNFTFAFSVATTGLPALKAAGITHASLANNHSNDFGTAAFANTVRELKKVGIEPLGLPVGLASTSVSILSFGRARTVGIIAFQDLHAPPSEPEIKTLVTELQAETDLQVAYVHWGTEYEHRPSSRQRTLAKILADLGFDLVIGHHPHVIQSVERIGETIVFYSLGNFIFDQYFSDAVRETLALLLEERGGEAITISLVPFESKTARAQPRQMTAQEGGQLLAWLAAQSDTSLESEILRGEITLVSELATSSKTAIMSE